MYILLIIFHVIVCIVLIAVILLQAGKGAGLTEAFGGEAAQSVLGTQAPQVLKKITAASAIAFLITSLILGMVTSRRGRSLFMAGPDTSVMPVAPQGQTAPVVTPKKPVREDAPGETREVPETEAQAAQDAQ